jgi:hypothetical protein
MSELLNKIIAADLIIWSFPLYYFSVPSALKTVIDRQLPLNLPLMSRDSANGGHPSRWDLSHQGHVVISTCGFWKSAGNYDGVSAMFDHMYGAGNYTGIFCGQGELFRVPELKSRTDAYLDLVRRAGAEFALSGISADTQAKLAEPLYARRVFEDMADASWNGQETQDPAADHSVNFTRQMAALYRPDGKERVLDFHFTDIDRTYQILATPQGARVITEGLKPCTTRIETSYELWKSIARGEVSGSEALFRKQYRVLGDFDVMLRWDELFCGASAGPPREEQGKALKTNMTVLLAPWVVIWTALYIDPAVGGALGIIAAAAVPLAWLAFRPTLFERISVLAVSLLSLPLLFGADIRVLLPASYGAFGLMWLATVFAGIPLTAHYSQNRYGGEKAFKNPLFLHTNRILTACWGVLYLLTPFWTYALMTSAASPLAGFVNLTALALMGGFTLWFQRWYPASRARG